MEAPFDTLAPAYDAATEHPLWQWLRSSVWTYLEAAFAPGDAVLELGCGPGADALWLARRGARVVATDASEAMLAVARRRAAHDAAGSRITFARLDLAAATPAAPPAGSPFDGPFDGAFSNFGALNCLPDRRPLARALAVWIRPGGRLVLVVMGPFCPWEWAWYGLRGQVRTAFRRLRPGTLARLDDDTRIPVWYPSPRRLRQEFAPFFRPLTTAGVGVVLPPSFAADLVARRPGLFARLAPPDRRLGRRFPGTWFNDHYLVVLERTGEILNPNI